MGSEMCIRDSCCPYHYCTVLHCLFCYSSHSALSRQLFQYPADAGAGTEEYQKDTGRGNVYGDQYRVYDFPGSSGSCEHGGDPCGICQDAGGISPGDGLCDPVCDPHRNGISHIREVCKEPV